LNAPRIGVFGGAFDPPHNAHVALARSAVEQLGLDELRIFPTGQAWHKARELTPADHRLAMAKLAFGRRRKMVVDPREIRRVGPTYTLDTLRELKQERPQADWVLIMGADQAQALPNWHGWREILAMAVIAIAQRPDASGGHPEFNPAGLPDVPPEARFERINLPPMDTSATDIRARAAAGQSVSPMVPPAVARYIALHHLYRTA